MALRTAAAAVIGAGCIAAAGVGGYLAVRATRGAASAESRIQANAPGAHEVRREASQPATSAPETTAAVSNPPREETLGGAATVPPPAPPAAAPVERAVEPPRPERNAERVPLKPAVEPAPAERHIPSRERQAEAAPAIPKAEPPPPVPTPVTVPPPTVEAPPPVTTSVLELPPPPQAAVARPRVTELTVAEGSVMGIRLESGLSSETARVEDPISAIITRDVTVDGVTAIPTGARLEGHVSVVERGGRFRERARIGIRFTTLVLDDKTRVRIDTDAIYRDGESPTGEATSKIGASAVVGSILGAVIGGRKGAAIGGAAGAAGGSAAVAAGGRNAATITAGAALTVRFTSALTLQVERDAR